MKFALMDLGSNSLRMYLLDAEDQNHLVLLQRERVMTRLSEGMGDVQTLRPDAMTRTISALKKFADIAYLADAKILAVATAAVRKAKNRAEFCDRVQRETGVLLHIISGQLEAFFDFHGVAASLPKISDALLCDTGGGSTELILMRGGCIRGKQSLPFGAMSLTDRFLRDGSGGDAVARVRRMLERAWLEVPFLKDAVGLSLIGLGGSAVALPAMDRALFSGGDGAADPHGYAISAEHMRGMVDALAKRTPLARITELGVEAGRADTILGGVLPGYALMEAFSMPQMVACTGGLREGILAVMQKEGLTAALSDPAAFLEQCETAAQKSI